MMGWGGMISKSAGDTKGRPTLQDQTGNQNDVYMNLLVRWSSMETKSKDI